MKSKFLLRLAKTGLLVLAVGISMFAQNPTHAKFSGVINAYSPQTTTGPYEVRGPWSLELNGGKANFSAALNMILSDGWAITLNGGNFDPNGRGAHTHHIVLRRRRRCADYEWIQGKRHGYDYTQRKSRARFTGTLGSRHYGWNLCQIFEYHAGFRRSGVRPFRKRAARRSSSKRQEIGPESLWE